MDHNHIKSRYHVTSHFFGDFWTPPSPLSQNLHVNGTHPLHSTASDGDYPIFFGNRLPDYFLSSGNRLPITF